MKEIQHITALMRAIVGENDNKTPRYDLNLTDKGVKANIRGKEIEVTRLRIVDPSGTVIKPSFLQITEGVALAAPTIVVTDNNNANYWIPPQDVFFIAPESIIREDHETKPVDL